MNKNIKAALIAFAILGIAALGYRAQNAEAAPGAGIYAHQQYLQHVMNVPPSHIDLEFTRNVEQGAAKEGKTFKEEADGYARLSEKYPSAF
jgi:hypothetical protein